MVEWSAAILLAYAEGETVVAVSRRLGQPVTTVNRTVNRALAVRARAALDDLKRPGRPRTIAAEARPGSSRWPARQVTYALIGQLRQRHAQSHEPSTLPFRCKPRLEDARPSYLP